MVGKYELVSTLATVFVAAACVPQEEVQVQESIAESVVKATAVLHPTAGNEASVTVVFTATDSGIMITGEFEGLSPGEHGFHIHEWGNCTAPDGTSAGGHFNPTGMPHGAPDDVERHVGDLGNLTADEQGSAQYDRTDTVIAFEGERSIIGRGVIVHGVADDFVTQPTGAAGPRVACGVIGIAQASGGM